MKVAGFCLIFIALFSTYQCQSTIAVRFVHAISNAPNIAVYFENTLAFSDIDFGGVTQYRDLDSGTYNIRVVQANNGALIFEINGMELNDEHTTIVAHGSTDDQDDFPYALTKLADDNNPQETQARMRFYHAAAGAPTVNLAVNNQTIFSDLEYTGLSDYEDVNEGFRAVEVFDAEQGDLLLQVTLPFDDATIVNLYLAGTRFVSSDRLTLIVSIDLESGNRVDSSNTGSMLAISFVTSLGLAVIL